MNTMIRCKQCGKFMADEYRGNYLHGRLVCTQSHRAYDNKEICFECEYWNEKVDSMTNHPDMMIPFVAGHQYFVADIDPAHENDFFKGFGGAKMEGTFFDTGITYLWDNVWNGSDIPKRFWKKLPNTATLRWLH